MFKKPLKKRGCGSQDSPAPQQASKKQRTSLVELSTLQVNVSPEVEARLEDICYSEEDRVLGNSLVNCVIAGATYCKTNPDSQRSWTNDIGAKPDNQSLSLETAIHSWRELNSASMLLSNVTNFVVSWLQVVANQEQNTPKGRPPRWNTKKTTSAERTRRYRERAIGNFLILLINSLSESSGKKAYNVCTALAGTYICCQRGSFC